MATPRLPPLTAARKQFLKALIPTSIFSLAINTLLFVSPIYMLQIYDRVLSNRSVPTLVAISIIAFSLLAIYGVIEFIRSRCLARVSVGIDEALTKDLMVKMVKTKVAAPNGSVETVVSDVDRLREFIAGPLLVTMVDMPWVPLYLALCYLFDPWLGVVATVGAILLVVLALLNEFRTHKLVKESTIGSIRASASMAAALRNSDTLYAMGMDRAVGERWSTARNIVLDIQIEAGDRSGFYLSATKFVRMALQSAILGVGAYLAIHQRISPGMILATSIMMGKALSPIELAMGQWKQFVAARQGYGRMTQLLAMKDDEDRLVLPALKGDLSVEQLHCFVPGTQSRVIKGVDLKLPAGETMVVIGPSGAGKTSFTKALMGLWPSMSGHVRLDGADLRQWNREQLGRSVGYLPQNVQLFPGTVAENISRFSAPDHEAIVKAASLAGVHEMILALPNGYETEVGEDGSSLSGGQRQRIGLARAFYGDPKFIVLDEPNSNLDTDGDNALIRALTTARRDGATVVIVSHRNNILQHCDKLLVLKDGAMQAFGPPQEVFGKPQAVAKPAGRPYTLSYGGKQETRQ
ncbi:type I secretion system permease/ATPase [Rhizobium sp. BK176]|uniref:type I secretion system permease/ATPase n=1 Tax=Rhizobium sp. BK176 TaxID=2587071 RepID=UPI0021685B06|nr:type I secretion system permease/ATPase [Rhizobium sp. BK176]MCS4089860.1 PrtD family type I secretion system ABC transporter [Rhizobium sp. BK176]